MKDRKVILFLAIGFLLIGTGFLIGRSANKTQSITESDSESILPSVISIAQTQNRKDSISGKAEVLVAKVLDGDTIQTSQSERIRYIGINAPEKGQPFSSQATAENKRLILTKKVRLEFDIQTKDRYGRTLAYVFVGETFVNLKLLKMGLAVSYTIQPNVKYQDEFIKAQKEARNSCLGLWEKLCN